jgi:hypothetical protein
MAAASIVHAPHAIGDDKTAHCGVLTDRRSLAKAAVW